MSRKSLDEPLVRVNLKFFSRDWEEWQRIYGRGGASEALRVMMRNQLRRLNEETTMVEDMAELEIGNQEEDFDA